MKKKAEKHLPAADFKPDIFEDIVELKKSELERGWRILMCGIVVEVVAAFGISVISGLEIAESNERSERLEAANLVLRSNVVALEISQKPRRITLKQKERFIDLLRTAPKGPVKIFVGRQDDEMLDYTKHIREILDAAGYGVTNGPGVIPLGERTGIYTPIGDEKELHISVFMMFYASNNLSISWPGIKFSVVENYLVTKFRSDDPRAIPAIINGALQDIGVQTKFTGTTELLAPGDWGIYVRQKF